MTDVAGIAHSTALPPVEELANPDVTNYLNLLEEVRALQEATERLAAAQLGATALPPTADEIEKAEARMSPRERVTAFCLKMKLNPEVCCVCCGSAVRF